MNIPENLVLAVILPTRTNEHLDSIEALLKVAQIDTKTGAIEAALQAKRREFQREMKDLLRAFDRYALG